MKSRLSKLVAKLKFKRPDNLKVVVLSIGAATVFWLFNALNEEASTTVNYPVSWQFDSEKYIVVDELPEKIRINVKGLGWNLLRASFGFKVKPITIALGNPAASKKIAGVSLTNRIANELDELKLNYILDDTLRLNIDLRGQRSFRVDVDSAGISLAENYRITSPIACNVELMELSGPATMLKSIPSDSFLLHIREENINSDFDEQVAFEIERPELFLFNPRSARVTFSVAEFTAAERQVVIEQVGFPENSKVFLQDTVSTVEFWVRADLEPDIVADSFKVIADYSLVNMLDSTLTLHIQKTPPQVTDVRLALPQVKLGYEQ